MPKITIFNAETVGVDMKTNPLFLSGKKLHSAVNLAFDEGTVRTRPGFAYRDTIASGCFQGAGEYRPARGISSRAFGESGCSLFVVVDGALYRDGCPTGFTPFSCAGAVHVFQAEPYLIFQSPNTKTYWWDGTTLVESKGMNESDWSDPATQQTILEHTTPVANIPVCEDIIGDNMYVLLFTVYDMETNEVLPGVKIEVTHNDKRHAIGTTGGDGKWSCRVYKKTYQWTMELGCYKPSAGGIRVRGNEEVVDALEPSCAECDWDIVSSTVDNNGSSTDIGTVIISNNGDGDLTITDISVACGGSVIDPPPPIVVPPDGNLVVKVLSTNCQLTDTNLTVITDCGELVGIWSDPATGGCGFSVSGEHADTEDPEPAPEDLYYWVVYDIVNTGTEPVELTEMVFSGMSTSDPLFTSSVYPITLNVGESRHIAMPWIFDGSGYELRGESVLLITSCGSTSLLLPNDPPKP